MTDASLSVRPSNGYDHAHAHAPPLAHVLPLPLSHEKYSHAAVIEDVQEDDGQISCVCGYADDDGATVACDECNRWQHQACYYPQYEERQLPDELQHYCVDCKPRSMDVARARQRQREKREQADSLANGFKRNPSKSHKKKVKDVNLTAVTNGWPLDKSRHDRNSASPRDQPPPPKRPKTSHRASDSTATVTATKNGHSRKRNASSVVNTRRSVSRSPDDQIDLYSKEFLQSCRHDDWTVTDANLHNSIAMTNALSDWLNMPEETFRSSHGLDRAEVLMRWDSELDDIPGKAELDIVETVDDTVRYDDVHPTWRAVTVSEPVAGGAYLGELKGHVGFKEDYQADGSNRWKHLRHPEPFVFFHPKLPVVIDARREGTELRYVRRSCEPNARLQILVTDGKDYHFCFMATQQIEPGVEVAVGWDTSAGLPELARRKNISPDDMENLSAWVSTALANCGPCACRLPEGECLMARFDRRTRDRAQDDAQMTKPTKQKKRKTGGQHASPATTMGINSRSGSEVRKIDPDDDNTDARSTSGSAGEQTALSRDNTPNTHYSANGLSNGMPELSERERKKLAKEEEMFRRQEEERAGKNAKKKRSSAGSAAPLLSSNTTKSSNSSTNNSKYVDAGTSRSPNSISAKSANPGHRRVKGTSKSAPRNDSRPAKRAPRSNYVNAETQCDLDLEEAAARPKTLVWRPFVSTRQRLLERCARNINITRVVPTPSPSVEPPSAGPPSARLNDEDSKMDVDVSTLKLETMASPPLPTTSTDVDPAIIPTIAVPTIVDTPQDIDMADADEERSEQPQFQPPSLTIATSSTAEEAVTSEQSPHTEPHAPPWPHRSSTSDEGSEPAALRNPQRPANMHFQMPPPTANLAVAGQAPLSAGMSSNPSASPLVHSPLSSLPPLLSTAVSSGITPSPARKKMSLSDYTRRTKAKDKDPEGKPERDSSPASTASGPVMPLSGHDHPHDGSAIDDDVRMDDVASETAAARS